MTREEAIEGLKPIIRAVFTADDKIRDEWQPKFKEVDNLPPDEMIRLVDDYVTAVAAEIVDKSNLKLEEVLQ